jgi:hypothetical protein
MTAPSFRYATRKSFPVTDFGRTQGEIRPGGENSEYILAPHLERSADAGKCIDHQCDQRPIAQRDGRGGGNRIQQGARVFGREDRRSDRRYRARVERDGNRFLRRHLVGMNPRKQPHPIHLRPLQTGDVGRPIAAPGQSAANRRSTPRCYITMIGNHDLDPRVHLPACRRFVTRDRIGSAVSVHEDAS